MKEERKIKAIVCGTTFGQFYCEALRRMPEILFDGILSTGSVRSQRCAERYGVRSYTAADELPADIQLACVAVRSGVLGGNGTELAAALLERGIHVIQEQPVHYKDAERCIRIAKQHGVCYRVGDLYEYLPNIRCFLESAEEFMKHLRVSMICTHAADAHSIILHPASSTHRQLNDEELEASGVKPDLIRICVGIENADDIIEDIAQALSYL